MHTVATPRPTGQDRATKLTRLLDRRARGSRRYQRTRAALVSGLSDAGIGRRTAQAIAR